MEVTVKKVFAAEEADGKLERAIRAGVVRRYHGVDWIGAAADAGSITESEAQLLREVEALTQRVIAVDHFAPDELVPHYRKAAPASIGHNSKSLTGASQ